VDLPNEYGVNATFNVADLSLFDVGDDSRSNPFEERGDDAIQATKDPLEVLVGPVTRLGAKRSKRLSIDFFKIRGLRWTSRGY
jgi:hypothetical protein